MFGSIGTRVAAVAGPAAASMTSNTMCSQRWHSHSEYVISRIVTLPVISPSIMAPPCIRAGNSALGAVSGNLGGSLLLQTLFVGLCGIRRRAQTWLILFDLFYGINGLTVLRASRCAARQLLEQSANTQIIPGPVTLHVVLAGARLRAVASLHPLPENETSHEGD